MDIGKGAYGPASFRGQLLHPRFWKSHGPGGPRDFVGKGSWSRGLAKRLQVPGVLYHSRWQGEQAAGGREGFCVLQAPGVSSRMRSLLEASPCELQAACFVEQVCVGGTGGWGRGLGEGARTADSYLGCSAGRGPGR